MEGSGFGAASSDRIALLGVVFSQVEVGVFLAATAIAGDVGANVADVAPISNEQAFAVFVNEHGALVNRVNLEFVGCGEMTQRFKVHASKTLVGDHSASAFIAIETDGFAIGRLQSRGVPESATDGFLV